jgi:transaldolase
MNPLLQLIEAGQSYWLDNLTRAMIVSGDLRRRVSDEGLRGVTSNPAIFHKAIAGSEDYDAQIRELTAAGKDVAEIYERLVVTDVRDACDVLRPVYDASQGVDGFVSLEVSPHLAHETEGTMLEARRLFQAVRRPNLLIKIPGTREGLPAIEEMLYEGMNINITLLFAVERYEAVAEAYLRAFERRLAQGKGVGRVASVASFFLSRIDVLTDELLGELIKKKAKPSAERLLGRLAIANAKLAYQRFKAMVAAERWRGLEEKGARVQRLLWASTSTKNPRYSDVYYVEPLVGAYTVNTMPNETIAAFADHGRVVRDAVESGVDEARQVLADLQRLGIDPERVTEQLLREGVQKFIEPFDKLMDTLAEKRRKILGGKEN